MNPERGFNPEEYKRETKKQTPEFFNSVKEGPYFHELLESKSRTNRIELDSGEGVTETEALQHLDHFISETIYLANKVGNSQIKEMAVAFKENLVYVGEQEFKEATQFFANHILEKINQGKEVYLYTFFKRSERYVGLRILEELQQKNSSENIHEKVHVSGSYKSIAKAITEKDPESACVMVPDDFVISGTRISNATNILQELFDRGVEPEKAHAMIEAIVIAAPENKKVPSSIRYERNGEKVEEEFSLNMLSYYTAPEYQYPGSRPGSMLSEVSMTGSHCDTDYGYEELIDQMIEFHKKQGNEIDTSKLPINITRPYAIQQGEYIDPELRKRWEKIEKIYGLE